MTVVPRQTSSPRKRALRDLRTVGMSIGLLALSGSIWVWSSRRAVERRENVLAKVPAFPARGQEHPRMAPSGNAVRPTEPRRPDPPPAPQPARSVKPDPMTSFVLQPSHNVALVHVNALLNTPLFDRIRQCLPEQWGQFTETAARMGIDLERDVDRLAMSQDGMALSGFFEGKPIARTIAGLWHDAEERQHRGQSIWISKYAGIAQVGNLLLTGTADSMERLVDRALDPPPQGADPYDVYGDVFMRSDLTDLRGSGSAGGSRDPAQAILDGLSGVTVRANVWDMVALSIEGKPQAGRNVADLAAMARGAISLAREQLDPSEVELATLAELAKVTGSGDALNIDLALPMNDIFDKLHFPCPGAQGTGQAQDQLGSASRDKR
ncbi:MAG TPA: hypothetical protein VEP66_12225 [Myxococcales bacterium]|nr:hypothetical protein [Myxococcales bacterium]